MTKDSPKQRPMETMWQELLAGADDSAKLLRLCIRLIVASVLGGLVGVERQHEGKAAGARTHMLVALGSALFTLVALETGKESSDLSRVIQGIAVGIGFLGAGTILKLSDLHEIKGLTTAASIWMTAAIGVAVGAGRIGLALVSVALSLLILYVLHRVERWLGKRGHPDPHAGGTDTKAPPGGHA